MWAQRTVQGGRSGSSDQGDQFSGKPGNVRELIICWGKLSMALLPQVWGYVSVVGCFEYHLAILEGFFSLLSLFEHFAVML